MAYLSDAFYIFIYGTVDSKKEQHHIYSVPVYLIISNLGFLCVSQFCILICKLW